MKKAISKMLWISPKMGISYEKRSCQPDEKKSDQCALIPKFFILGCQYLGHNNCFNLFIR